MLDLVWWKYFFYIIQLLIGYHLVFPAGLFLFWIFFKKKHIQSTRIIDVEKDIAVIITAYQQTFHIPATVKSVLNSLYTNFHIYVVADNCQPNDHLKFDSEKVSVLFPPKVIASNTGSHFFAVQNFIRSHELLTIVDSDNLLDSNLLRKLNEKFHEGFEAVQGLRLPKNLDTNISRLDAARDIYYHFYDGKLLFESGSSATLAGSGMAFTVKLYLQFLKEKEVKGAGFDKVLQYFIVKSNKRIAFQEEAIIFDEKTSETDQLVNQRARWINTWFKYFKFGFSLLFKGIKNLSWNQFLFGGVLLRPPLFIFLLLAIFFMIADIFMNVWLSVVWLTGLILFAVGFAVSLLYSHTDKKIYKALYSIPLFIFFQIKSLLVSQTANQRSVATKHSQAEDK